MMHQKNKGFSLLEITIALMVLVVLMVATVSVTKNTREYDHLLENEAYMSEVRSALIMFVKVNGFLPCPDDNGDGKESRENTSNFACTTDQGKIPHLDLGVSATDAWGQPLLYAVNAQADSSGTFGFPIPQASARYFNNQNAPTFSFDTLPLGRDANANANRGVGNYRVCGDTLSLTSTCTSGSASDDLVELAAIAVVVSFGKNGAATWSAFGSPDSGWSAAEAENMDDDLNFWKASGSEREGQKFDDQLFWILGGDVKYAIISSGGQL